MTVIPHDPQPIDTMYGHHVDYPHWPGTLYDCPACERQMAAEEHVDPFVEWGTL